MDLEPDAFLVSALVTDGPPMSSRSVPSGGGGEASCEEKHRDFGYKKSEVGVSFDTHLNMGTSTARGGFCVSPDLQERLAEDVMMKSAVLKERRTFREERNVGGPRGGHISA